MCPFLLARVGCLFVLAPLFAQAPELPRLLRLGPMPGHVVATLRVRADGTRDGEVPAGALMCTLPSGRTAKPMLRRDRNTSV